MTMELLRSLNVMLNAYQTIADQVASAAPDHSKIREANELIGAELKKWLPE